MNSFQAQLHAAHFGTFAGRFSIRFIFYLDPQPASHVVVLPVWDQDVLLGAAYLSTQDRGSSDQRARLSTLRGGSITLLATVHSGPECFAQAACAISAPTAAGDSSVDAWIPLLRKDGTPALSPVPLVPSSLHIR